MSKTKTKRARRELKREGDKKIFAIHKKNAKAAAEAKPTAKAPAKKKHGKTSAPVAAATTSTTTSAHVQPSQKRKMPFGEYDHILLVGEGDFSFTRSLAIEHGCANVTATSYDDEEDLHSNTLPSKRYKPNFRHSHRRYLSTTTSMQPNFQAINSYGANVMRMTTTTRVGI